MRAAAVQLNATDDKERNLERADALTRAAAADGAQLVVLPEKWTVLGDEETLRAGAEPLDGPAVSWARATARELGIDLVAGSLAEAVKGEEKSRNTSVHVGPDGELQGVYRKLHMFDVVVEGREYRESALETRGARSATSTPAAGPESGRTSSTDFPFPGSTGT